ncbi:MAG: AAA family ATPase [Candidatus Lokiarchaeota archaeon]|nr:AAA family ATPase [Candidatus Lokiarchaeota archaeon]
MKKEKYLQVFNYLLEFSKIRSKAVRDINSAPAQYVEKIWLSDIPKNDKIDSILEDDFNEDSEYWLKIRKPIPPEAPEFPSPPKNLKNWIDEDSLVLKDEFPVLKEFIFTDDDDKKIYLEDYPDIKNAYNEYIDNKWFDDSEKYWKDYENYERLLKDYEAVNSIYKKLFSLSNKTQQFGEEFEFVLGLGLLYFKENDDTPLICRHIFTYGAEIKFDSSQIKISPSTHIQIETDAIIDLFDQFDSNNIINAEKIALKFANDNSLVSNPFDRKNKETIQIFADRLRHDGVFKDELFKPNKMPAVPTILFAPALILRKRNTRSYTALYEKIINDIKESEDVNISTLNDIIGFDDNLPDDEGPSDFINDIDNIYFPKEYNDEQMEIVEKTKRNNKVLVQGPPGTGKSHTIANLICHFLANGKKILITAYTKRALDVLKEKLPDDFKSLTVNFLGGDSSSIQDLESSVNEINDKLSNANLSNDKIKIDKYEKELVTLKENRSLKKNELLKIKEQESRKQIINENYQGLLIDIAQEIEKDSVKYDWFRDRYHDINNFKLIENVKHYSKLIQYYQQLDCKEFDYEIPDKNELFSILEFKEYAETNTYLVKNKISLNVYDIIKCKDHIKTKELLDSLYKICLSIEKKKQSKIRSKFNDLKGNRVNWEKRLVKSKKILDSLGQINLRSLDRNVEIVYPKNKSLIVLKNDATKLLHYLKSGGKLDGVSFKLKKTFLPNEIKEKLYFIDSVIVNGSPCDTIWEFSSVIEDIRVRELFQDLAEIWSANIQNISKKYSDYFDAFNQLQSISTDLLNNFSEADQLLTEIKNYSSIDIQHYDSNEIRKYIDDIEKSNIIKKFKDFNIRKEHICFYLSNNNLHPISLKIKDAISEFDKLKYKQLLEEIDIITSKKIKYNEFKKLETELKSCLPILIDDIIDGTFDNNNINDLNEAMYFKHAKIEIQKLLDEDYEKELITDLISYNYREKKLISKIASLKAWIHVLSNLQQNRILRQHLEAWVLAVRRIGRTGRGRRALRFRNEAQKQMEYCKTTVPCWIMPLYKVAETISPEQGIYDYVIIDEASQLGPEALFLFYIAKNIIIVGDDKQTSPEYVGVNADTMNPFINKYLKRIPFANFFDTQFSIFDQAKIFCDGFTVLREHFRCMPEIIEFSNKLFYAPDGKSLYPLKQYSENRLEPLKHVFCGKGYVEGRNQNMINRVEAEEISVKIFELINDKNYKGKTFGIICLQGKAQSALIENILLKKIGEKEFKERKIVCGNSTSFQGDERDIIFLSLVTAQNHNRSSLTRPEDERRFNVAVSRAIEQIWLFHSVQLEDLSNTSDLRYKLIDHFQNYKANNILWKHKIDRKLGNQPEPFESWFEVDVYNDIVGQGYSVIPQYEVAKGKYRIDLVILCSDGSKIAIECDGDKWHGAEQYQNDLMRQKVLERCGWQFFRVRGGEYYSNRVKTLEPLWEILKERQDNNKPKSNSEEKKKIKDEELNPKNKNHVHNVSKNNKKIYSKQKNLFDDNVEQIALSKEIINKHQFQKIINVSQENKSNGKSEILVFTNKFNVYKTRDNGFYNKQHILDSINLENNEKYIYITRTEDFSGYMLFGFENGKVAKIFMDSYKTETQRKRLKNAFNNNSKLVFIDYIKDDVELVAISSINKVLIFDTAQINPKGSKTSQGNQVMKPKNNSLMRRIKKANQVNFINIDYYKKNIPATGNYLLSGDKF